MFNRICVPPREPEKTLYDLGLLAEALIFYKEVHLILTPSSLQGILTQLGPDLFIELIAEDYLHIHYINHFIGAVTTGQGSPFPLYGVGLIQAKKHNIESVASKAFIGATGKSGRGRRFAIRFCQKVSNINYQLDITKEIADDMKDGKYLEEYIRRRVVARHGIDNKQTLDDLIYRFSLVEGHGFLLQTNLNLVEMKARGIDLPELNNPAAVLSNYATTVADMSLWAQLQSEAALTPMQSDVLTARIDNMITRRALDTKKVSAFQDFVFDNASAIRETINAGGRSFRELLPILAKARKFSEWISNQAVDANLIKAYHKEIAAETWIDKLPAKSVRWSLFTGVGMGLDTLGAGGIGTSIGVALSALDCFILDKIVKGWKPHHFIEGPMKDFIR